MKLIKHTYQVGEDVSYGFNGDYYHAGQVEKLTKCFLTTTRGNKFSLTTIETKMEVDGSYETVKKEVFRSVHGGTWALCHGIVNEQNPHF